MLCSFEHSFIFIKTMKTASSSIELALSRYCGPTDIVSPSGYGEDLHRFREFQIKPRNFSTDKEFEALYNQAIEEGNRRRLQAYLRRPNHPFFYFNPHIIARKLRHKIPKDFWDRAVKVTTERHPYEKAVSLAGMRHGTRLYPGASFGEVVDAVLSGPNPRIVGRHFYGLGDKIVVDEFIRCDNLKGDFDRVLLRLGLRPISELPHRRNSERKAPAAEMLNDAQKAKIYELCAEEFERFGWER